ncbi:hypothetical protein Nepgr_032349 [Nepenthes gracilis]|uniref:Uncharacterized protein n=1 Tax=Nepenthes gracilis TaxID=150966 RepID=A0AAD3TJV7_NEPGR|nr:hypothetical protein Nepgr_032349 [Nepenthes gracilis]
MLGLPSIQSLHGSSSGGHYEIMGTCTREYCTTSTGQMPSSKSARSLPEEYGGKASISRTATIVESYLHGRVTTKII